jgi:hypothetical protein
VLPPKLEVLGTVFQVMGIALSRMISMVGAVFLQRSREDSMLIT